LSERSFHDLVKQQTAYELNSHNQQVADHVIAVMKQWDQNLGLLLPENADPTTSAYRNGVAELVAKFWPKELVRNVRIFERDSTGKIKHVISYVVPSTVGLPEVIKDEDTKEQELLLHWVEVQAKKKLIDSFYTGVLAHDGQM